MPRLLRVWPEALVVLCAFAYDYPCGLRDFHPLDSSIVFDGGYRMLLGQVPWRDFFAPVGPMLFWAQGLLFRAMGVTYLSYITLAAILNALAVACVLGYSRALTSDRRLRLAAGLVCAVFGLPMHRGHPWYDQAAFLFVHAALLLLAPGAFSSSPSGRSRWTFLLGGASLALAFYCKQSTGGVAAVCLTLYLLQTGARRDAAWFVAGGVGGFAALSAWWAAGASPGALWRYAFALPLTSGRLQTLLSSVSLPVVAASAAAGALTLKRREWLLWLPISLFLGAALGSQLFAAYFFVPLAGLLLIARAESRALLMALTLMQYAAKSVSFGETHEFLGFVGIQLLLCASAVAQSPLGQVLPAWLRGKGWDAGPAGRFAGASRLAVWGGFAFILFAGVRYSLLRKLSPAWLQFPVVSPAVAAAGLAAGAVLLLVAWDACRSGPPGAAWAGGKPRWLWPGAAAAAALAVGIFGIRQSLVVLAVKSSQEDLMGSFRKVEAAGLEGLRMDAQSALEMEQGLAYLKRLPPQDRPFFVFPGHTVFYGLLGQPPPQPVVWFHPGLTFRAGEPDEGRVCGALAANKVRTVLVYGAETTAVLAQLPCLKAWVERDFAPAATIGRFQVFRARSGSCAERRAGS
ncbi:MAG: hypothetical protein HY927_03860 [Elusimicrobia bacterium]|nr:hypothetical protein [Elusimicrobiota bacterium]